MATTKQKNKNFSSAENAESSQVDTAFLIKKLSKLNKDIDYLTLCQNSTLGQLNTHKQLMLKIAQYIGVMTNKKEREKDYSLENTQYGAFLTTVDPSNFSGLCQRVTLLGEEYYDYYGTYPVDIVKAKGHLNDALIGSTVLEKDRKYIAFRGQSPLLYSTYRLLNLYRDDDHFFGYDHPFLKSSYYEFNFSADFLYRNNTLGSHVFNDLEKSEDGFDLENAYVKIKKGF
jgi:hypothetical protein